MNATQLDDKGIIQVCPQCGQRNRVQFASLANTARCGQCKQALPVLDLPLEIDEESHFDSLMKSAAMPVLVDFWADWCGPCKMMAPELKHVAAGSVGKFLVAKVNTEGLPVLAQRMQIHALPTLVLFEAGNEVARTEGALPAVQIQRFVEQTIRAAA